MSINLTKNKPQILDAWTKVSKGEDGYDWAIFGYEKKSLELKVEAIGSGGIDAVAEELNDGKIQYAFVRVKDPNTQLIKFILVNFQGEAVLDLVHKGTCANHIKDVSKMLMNHLTVTATNIDDLDESTILAKVSKITSAYNFAERAAPTDEKFNIGTNYTRIIPTKEINVVKRDEFWKKEEEVEKTRVAAEQQARKLANLKLEEERTKREQNEHNKRELMNKDTLKQPTQAPKPVSPIQMKPVEQREDSSRPKAEEMRQDRRREAQELIGNRVNTAKAMWQQQAEAQNKSPPPKAAPPAKPVRKTILPKIEPDPEPEPAQPEPETVVNTVAADAEEPTARQIEPLNFAAEDEHFSTIKRSPKTPDKSDNGFITPQIDIEPTPPTEEIAEPPSTPPHEKFQQIEQEELEYRQQQQQTQKTTSEVVEPQPTAVAAVEVQEEESELPMLKAVALYDYQAVDDTEITFDPGDIITHIDQIDEGWWQGYSERFGSYGLFPANYVELIN